MDVIEKKVEGITQPEKNPFQLTRKRIIIASLLFILLRTI